MSTDNELVRGAVEQALDALLVALVELDGVVDAEVPVDALDVALRGDIRYQDARSVFRVVFEDLGDVLGRDALFFEIESKMNAVVSTATEVGFRLGLSMAVKRSNDLLNGGHRACPS